MKALRVLLVDDHPVFVEALAVRLDSEPDLEVLPVAHSPGQALAELRRSRPTVVVVDLLLGEESGLAVLDHARAECPETKVVMLTAAADDVNTAVEAVRRGARAWLSKSARVDRLVRVIHGVARGEAWIPPAHLGAVLAGLTQGGPVDQDVLAALTAREREVLQCVVDGRSRSEIAGFLYLSPNTVRTHIQNLLVKLDAHSVLEAVAIARRAGMRQSGTSRGTDVACPAGTP